MNKLRVKALQQQRQAALAQRLFVKTLRQPEADMVQRVAMPFRAVQRKLHFTLHREIEIRLRLPGAHNVLNALAAQPWFQGTYWWLWSTDPTAGGLNDTSYTPQGKPALGVLNAFYKNL